MKGCFRAYTTLVFFLTTLGFAQQNAPPITRDVPGGLIHLDALVSDPSGRPVSGLRLEDFTLLDNGQPAKILTFSSSGGAPAKPDPPSRLILVIDAIDFGGLPADLVRDESVAVQRYLRQNGGRLTRSVSVYLIDDRGLWTVAHPAGDGISLANDIVHSQLKSIRPFAGSLLKASYDLVHDTAAISALKSIGQIATYERRRPGRKLLVWVGPNWGIGPGIYNSPKTKDQDPRDTQVWFSTLM